MREERKLQKLYFRDHPFELEPWRDGMFSAFSGEEPGYIWKFIGIGVSWWFILMFVVHFLMGHVFNYTSAKEAVSMTENMLSFFLPPYQEYKVWLFQFWFWGGIAVFVYIVVAQDFNDKARTFICQELSHDWFKEKLSKMTRQWWEEFRWKYLHLLSSLKDGATREQLYSSTKARVYALGNFRWHEEDYNNDSESVNEDEFRLFSDFSWKIEGEGQGDRVTYPLEYDIYPSRRKGLSRYHAIRKEAKYLIRWLNNEKVIDLYIEAGLKNGYLEEFTNQNGQQALRLTTPVENKAE